MKHEICVRIEINNKQVAFVTFIDFLSLTELTLHLEKTKGLEVTGGLISESFSSLKKICQITILTISPLRFGKLFGGWSQSEKTF